MMPMLNAVVSVAAVLSLRFWGANVGKNNLLLFKKSGSVPSLYKARCLCCWRFLYEKVDNRKE